jgi:membrane-associated protein
MNFDFSTLLDAHKLMAWLESVKTLAYLIVWSIVFAESGLLVGFFLPGDSLLFVAGFLCSLPNSPLNIAVMAFGCFVAAILGDSLGYHTGHKYGRKLFEKPDSRLFKRKYLVAAQDFFEAKGPLAIVLARFMPFVRTFAPIVAGIASMRYKTFITYNVVGGFLWGIGLTVLGYFLGALIGPEQLDKYLIPIVLFVMFISLAPSVWHMWHEKQKSKQKDS